MADVDSSDSTPFQHAVDPPGGDSVCSLVDGLARLRTDQPGQPLGLLFELFCGDDRPMVAVVDGAAP